MFDGMLQFTHITGPGVIHQGLLGFGREARDSALETLVEQRQEVLKQQRDVLAALPERRQGELDHLEPVIEILAKFALSDHLAQVAVGGRDHAGANLDGRAVADAFKLAFLQHAQELELNARRDVADLVQKDRTAAGQLEATLFVADGAGEGPLDVAEQLAFEQALGQSRAVDRHEGLRRTFAAVVQGLGHQLLAGAALAGNQGRGLGIAQILDQLEDALHAAAAADDVVVVMPLAELALETREPRDVAHHQHAAQKGAGAVLERGGPQHHHPLVLAYRAVLKALLQHGLAGLEGLADNLEAARAQRLGRDGEGAPVLPAQVAAEHGLGCGIGFDDRQAGVHRDDGLADAAKDGLQILTVTLAFEFDLALLIAESLVLQGVVGDPEQGLLGDGLDQVVEGPQSQRVGRGHDVGVAGDHDHRAVKPAGLDILEDIDTRMLSENDVDQNQIKILLIDGVHRALIVLSADRRVAGAFQKGREGYADALLVIDYEDPLHGRVSLRQPTEPRATPIRTCAALKAGSTCAPA
ncbi:MAG: hypothetical protein BWY87_01038 [Deltaproteobacteria bacterium ADurb.Bin510]|nr:MAG: hypothetical protein BWY87_01038 [Deltaproteobacteria bacterium ADurb.Bin510]